MSNEIIILESETQLESHMQEMKELAELTMQVSGNAKSPNTLNGYASDWEDFDTWCRQKKLQSLPASPQVVAAYLSDRATNCWSGPSGRLRKMKEKAPLKFPTLLHRLWGIKYKHKECGYQFDTGCKEIENVVSSLRRQNTAKEERKDPLLLSDIRGMVENLPSNLTGIRDKALLLVGFVSAMRRSEIAALSMQNLKFVEEGIEVYLNWSKTGARDLVIPYGSNPMTCPVRALKYWIKEANITEGAIFRSINKHGQINDKPLTGAAIAIIVKRNSYVQDKISRAVEKGEHTLSYAGHSLRAGFCTTAAMQGVPEHLIMAQAGHKKSDTTKKYIRIANKWKDNAAIKIGL
jgi:site-specific recombinase XerD